MVKIISFNWCLKVFALFEHSQSCLSHIRCHWLWLLGSAYILMPELSTLQRNHNAQCKREKLDTNKNFPGNLFRRQPINLAKLGFKRARDDPSEAYLETRQANVYVWVWDMSESWASGWVALLCWCTANLTADCSRFYSEEEVESVLDLRSQASKICRQTVQPRSVTPHCVNSLKLCKHCET